MHPLLKRILINGGLTALALAGIGFLFAHFVVTLNSGETVKPDEAASNELLLDSIRSNVPLMMAFWGFVFVVVGELIRWRISGKPAVAKVVEKQPDETEKLLNELLAQAEARMASEQGSGDKNQESGDKKQETETSEKK